MKPIRLQERDTQQETRESPVCATTRPAWNRQHEDHLEQDSTFSIRSRLRVSGISAFELFEVFKSGRGFRILGDLVGFSGFSALVL